MTMSKLVTLLHYIKSDKKFQCKISLRIYSLQWDGLYLDLDVLLVKPLDDLEHNFATRENEYTVSNGILAFSSDNVGRSVAQEAFRYLYMLSLYHLYCNTLILYFRY